MCLILRTTHENLPAGATVSSGRLSVQDMDNNLIFLQGITGVTGYATCLQSCTI